jgi:hypothetical protein
VRTVELLLDPGLDAEVRSVWYRLHAAGLPSLATHPHPTNRPHVTLAAAESLTGLPDLERDLPIAAALQGVHMFDGKAGVLVWCVVSTPELRVLQAKVFAALDGTNPLHAPENWRPHVSLALRVPPEQRAAALDLLGDLGTARGSYIGARSYDTETRTVVDL